MLLAMTAASSTDAVEDLLCTLGDVVVTCDASFETSAMISGDRLIGLFFTSLVWISSESPHEGFWGELVRLQVAACVLLFVLGSARRSSCSWRNGWLGIWAGEGNGCVDAVDDALVDVVICDASFETGAMISGSRLTGLFLTSVASISSESPPDGCWVELVRLQFATRVLLFVLWGAGGSSCSWGN